MIRSNEFSCEVVVADPLTAVLTGTLRLQSMAAYEQLLAPVRSAMEGAADDFTIDVSDVDFMNSSAVTMLARLILLGRAKSTRLKLRGREGVHWQRATLTTLGRLSNHVVVEWV